MTASDLNFAQPFVHSMSVIRNHMPILPPSLGTESNSARVPHRYTSIDWPATLDRLRAHGINGRHIARSLHLAPSSVTRWALGDVQPRHDHGEQLLLLFTETIGEEPPRRR